MLESIFKVERASVGAMNRSCVEMAEVLELTRAVLSFEEAVVDLGVAAEKHKYKHKHCGAH